VIQNSHIHQRGSGLLYSCRFSSQTCPITPAFCPAAKRLVESFHSRTPHARMLTMVRIAM
jgi:hypothetical protein